MTKKILLHLFPVYRIVYHYLTSVFIGLYMWKLKHVLRKFGKFNRIFFANIVEPYNVSIGHHVYINRGCNLITTGSEIEIGDYIMIGPNTTFVAQNRDISDYSKPMIFNNKYLKKKIIIENDVWIGANVTILPGVTVRKGAVVGAGSVVTKDVDSYSIFAGVPAKKLRDRFPESDKKRAEKIDLKLFENTPLDWTSWGVGDIVK